MQDIYNVRPLPYIIGTKSYIDSADAGLGGIGGFEEEPDAPPASEPDQTHTSADRAHSTASQDNASESGSFHDAPARRAPSTTTNTRPPLGNTSNYDYDDGEEDVEETFVNDDSTIASGNSSVPPPPRKSTGNPLKDMLNAQINNRGGASKPSTSSTAPAGAHTGASSSSNWDDVDDEESTAGESAGQQRSLASVVGRAPPTAAGGTTGKPPARKYSDDSSMHSDAPAASGNKNAASAGKGALNQEEGEEEDEEEDLFSANDDPFGLFGSSKPSAFARVNINCLAHVTCMCLVANCTFLTFHFS